jgi:hypothetical protein
MFIAHESSILVCFAAIQILGLISLVGMRLTGQSSWRGVFRGAFVLCLLGVGLAAMFAVSCHSGWWISCGATLAVMAVVGTLDVGRCNTAAAY